MAVGDGQSGAWQENVLLVRTMRGRNAVLRFAYHIGVDWRFSPGRAGIEMVKFPDHVITAYLILKLLF